MLGAKPKFAMKPGMKSSGAPLQTPQKELGDGRNGSVNRTNENGEIQDQTPSKTPPPHPGTGSRVSGVK